MDQRPFTGPRTEEVGHGRVARQWASQTAAADGRRVQGLSERHHELDDRLHQLAERSHLDDNEQLEESTLKKRKLQLKDRMEDILRRQVAAPKTASASY